LARTLRTWVFAVVSLTMSARATSRFDEPFASAPAEIRDDVQKLLAGMRQRAGLEAPDEVTEAEVSAADERVNAFEERACG
jgi:hypothetical protein